MSDAPLIVLGCGYVGTHVAKLAREAGRTVRVAARGTGRLQPLIPLGIEVKFADIAIPKQLTAVFTSLHGATVLYSVPPASSGPPGSAVRNALQASYGIGANCFIYLSSSGMYGPLPDDDTWIDEDSPLAHDDPPMAGVQVDEQVVSQNQFDRLRTVVLRLAPVYGPKRGVRERLKKGDYKILDEGQHAISRIHIDDVAKVIFAAEDKAPDRALLLVADDEPTTQGEYAKWLAERMGVPMPPSRSMYEPGASRVAHRNRKIRNARMKETLGIELTYPTYREGETAIEAALARE
ncbi:MAG: NAD-dependent epimerase/dehydratase family protein [Deltaproteobacteria bacterium]|nr:NAD-dependent epimerase/dehydratase family protein [Deltaproteobacteria bacterium]